MGRGLEWVARRYLEKSRQDATPEEARADTARLWRLFYFGGWPVPSSPGKRAAYEHDRLRGIVVQSPPIDRAFQPDFLRSNLLSNREYLLDVVPAFVNVVEGVRDVEGLEEVFLRLSLIAQRRSPTLELLLKTGDVPKEAWINPQGGYLGRVRAAGPTP